MQPLNSSQASYLEMSILQSGRRGPNGCGSRKFAVLEWKQAETGVCTKWV